VINKCLKELYFSLLAKYSNTFSINIICPDTDTAIIRANLAFKHCSPHTPINIFSFDFKGLYLNIPVPKAILLILSLYIILDLDPLHEFKIAISRTKHDSYNKNLQKMQQTLPTIHLLKINKQTLQQLMQLVLIDNSFFICEWIPFQIFQQTTGITMSTNCTVHFTNLSLVVFEILNKKPLDTYCPFMSRYIDDILTILAMTIIETSNFLIDFYKPLNLNLIPNTSKNNITIYLDIQLYTSQINNQPLSFGLYRKLISSFPYPKPSSYSPPHIIKGLCIIEALRISSRCTSPKNAIKEWYNFLYLLSLRRHNMDHINNILHKYIKNNTNPLVRKSKKWHRDNIDYHIVIDFSNSINYHYLNHFAKTLGTKNKHISIRMHCSLGASLKQLTRFFDVQKNLSFSLENNKIHTYIHPNDRKPVNTEPISPSHNVASLEFDELNSSNQNNNFSTLLNSHFIPPFNLSLNSLNTKVLKALSLPFSPVFSTTGFKQHHQPSNVFSSLSSLSTYIHTVDFPTATPDLDFEDLILHLAYGSSFPSPSSSSSPTTPTNTLPVGCISQKEFQEFHKLSIHVFSSSSFYYFLKQPYSKSH
jgi:hypothetical protein